MCALKRYKEKDCAKCAEKTAECKKKCDAKKCLPLTNYIIDEVKCPGCGICKEKCPVKAVHGEPGISHFIERDLCEKCGTCKEVCDFEAVSIIW